jgi:hypothetical protein
MEIRNLNLYDLVLLEKDAKFPLPNLSSNLYVIRKSLLLNDKLIGSFWTKLTSETSLILCPEVSNLTKARAIREVFQSLYCELQKLGLDDSHLFIQNDEEYVKLLKKHFGFKDQLGTALYIGKRN